MWNTRGITKYIFLGSLLSLSLLYLSLRRYQTRLMFFPSPEIKSTPANVGLEYEAVWLAIGERKTRGQVHGWWIPSTRDAAPVLLYFHGNGSNLGDLPHRAQRFHQLGYSVFLIDYRGYGLSSGPFPREQRVYADAEAAWQYLTQSRQIPAGQVVIYGQSIGGAIALNLATHHPEAAGVIVEASFTSMKDMVERRLQFPILPVDWLLTQRFESLEKVRSLQMPLLFLHGTADTVIPVAMGEALYTAAAQPKKLIIIENAGHNDLPIVGGERYTNSIQSFVEQYAK